MTLTGHGTNLIHGRTKSRVPCSALSADSSIDRAREVKFPCVWFDSAPPSKSLGSYPVYCFAATGTVRASETVYLVACSGVVNPNALTPRDEIGASLLRVPAQLHTTLNNVISTGSSKTPPNGMRQHIFIQGAGSEPVSTLSAGNYISYGARETLVLEIAARMNDKTRMTVPRLNDSVLILHNARLRFVPSGGNNFEI